MAVDISPNGEFAQAVYIWLANVPPGKVTTYGQLARLAGYPRHARFVGRLMTKLPTGSRLPWWRVVRSDGLLAGPNQDKQKQYLQEENVAILHGKVKLSVCLFDP